MQKVLPKKIPLHLEITMHQTDVFLIAICQGYEEHQASWDFLMLHWEWELAI